MTLTQYKKVIKSLTRDELEAHLFEMFKSSKVFKDIESSCWSVESNDELIASLQKRLEKVFWKEQFSLSECKGVLNDYLSRTVDEGTKALMHLAFAAEVLSRKLNDALSSRLFYAHFDSHRDISHFKSSCFCELFF